MITIMKQENIPCVCRHLKVISDDNSGEEICQSCGCVLRERLEENSNTSYGPEEYLKVSQTGQPNSLTYHDRGLFTVINQQNIDAFGRNIPNSTVREYSRLRRWDSRTKISSSSRSLHKGLIMLDGIKKKLALSDSAVERIASIYRKAVSLGTLRGRSTEEILTSCVFIGCKLEKIPRSLNEISLITAQNKGNVYKMTMMLIERLELKIEPVNASDYLTKIATNSGMSRKAEIYAFELLNVLKKKNIGIGKNPLSLCGTIAWLASTLSGDWITQKTIADSAGITSVSIRNNSKFIIRELGLDKNMIGVSIQKESGDSQK